MFTELDRKALLRALGETRRTCIRAQAVAPIHGLERKAADGVIAAIDAAGEALTGSLTLFHGIAHGSEGDGRARTSPGSFTPDERDLILEILVDELYVSAPNAPDHEALLEPVVDRLMAALEGERPATILTIVDGQPT